jgi:non-heme chloroperoxidase
MHDGRPQGPARRHQAVFGVAYTEDLKKIDVPSLVIHGDDHQIAPIGAAGLMSAKVVKGAKPKVYLSLLHGLPIAQQDEVNPDLLAFLQS